MGRISKVEVNFLPPKHIRYLSDNKYKAFLKSQ